MPGRPLPRHLLDLDPRHRELLMHLRAAGGYAFTQQLANIWPQGSRATAYRAIQYLADLGALEIREMPPRAVAILTRPAARYLGHEDRYRSDPSYHQLLTGVFRLAWFERERRHLTLDLPERTAPDPARLEAERTAARHHVDELAGTIRAAEAEKQQAERDREAALSKLFGGKAEAQRLAELITAKAQEIANLTRRHQEAQAVLQRAQNAVTAAKLAGSGPAPQSWRRQLQARGIYLDPGDAAPGLTFVALDLDRSRTWVRDTLRVCGQIAKSYGQPWRLLILTANAPRAVSLNSMARMILAAVPKAQERYRRAVGDKAKEQAANGIIDTLPVAVQPIDLGISEYLEAPGGRQRDVRELLTDAERQALAGLKGG